MSDIKALKAYFQMNPQSKMYIVEREEIQDTLPGKKRKVSVLNSSFCKIYNQSINKLIVFNVDNSIFLGSQTQVITGKYLEIRDNDGEEYNILIQIKLKGKMLTDNYPAVMVSKESNGVEGEEVFQPIS